jgi:glycosyltransferase involved in cell wall biosynthesis
MNSINRSQKHIAILAGSLDGGGAEKALLRLAKAFSNKGCRIDFLIFSKDPQIYNHSNNIRVIAVDPSPLFTLFKYFIHLPLKTSMIVCISLFIKNRKKIRSLPNIINYLTENNPDVFISSITVHDLISMWAKFFLKGDTQFVIRLANSVEWSKFSKDFLERQYQYLIRRWYPKADKIISVSQGLADEIAELSGMPDSDIHTINNPVDNRRINELASQEINDPWFQGDGPPIIISTARLHPQKDYPTLIKAFWILREKIDARLLILGEGSEHDKIVKMIESYGMQNSVRLLGYQKNPHAYVARSDVFVLSSLWEGFSNSLIEALSCGTKIVSTNCKHGTKEILDSGKYGNIVPVGDPEALAESIYTCLQDKVDTSLLKKQAKNFDISVIANRYLKVISA